MARRKDIERGSGPRPAASPAPAAAAPLVAPLVEPLAPGQHRWLAWALAGAVLFFAGGVYLGSVGGHSSTDNWIAIAAGRDIVQNGRVPDADPFSFTFSDKPFFNQNWLSHVIFYLLYEHVHPNAIVYFTWFMNLAIYSLIAAVVWLRSGSLIAGLLAAGVAGACATHIYDTRPQTVGYLCCALQAMLFHVLLAPRPRESWLLPSLMLPLMLFWGAAHGTFILGYVLAALFVAAWGGSWALDRVGLRALAPTTTPREVAILAAATGVAALLTLLLGPFGLENFTHPFVVQKSVTWKQVAEWNPPWVQAGRGLPVTGFWVVVLIGAVCTAAVLGLRVFASSGARAKTGWAAPISLGVLAVSALLIGVGLSNAFQVHQYISGELELDRPDAYVALLQRTQGWLAWGVAALISGLLLGVAAQRPVASPPTAVRATSVSMWFGLAAGALLIVGASTMAMSTSFAAEKSNEPEVKMFWTVVYLGAGVLTLGLASGALGADLARRVAAVAGPTPTTLFDVVLFLVGLRFAIQSRRFTALLFILSTPVLAFWLVSLAQRVRPGVRVGAALAAAGVAAAGGVWAGADAYRRAAFFLGERFVGRPGYNLLERFTDLPSTNPIKCIRFLRQVDAPMKLFAEWTVSGVCLAWLPQAKVFMDGRAQQVYSEQHYYLFNSLFGIRDVKLTRAVDVIESAGTDVVLLRPSADCIHLIEALYAAPAWKPVLLLPDETLFMRVGAPPFERLLELERAGTLVWPDDPRVLLTRADLALSGPDRSDPAPAIALLKQAAQSSEMGVARQAYIALYGLWRDGRKPDEAVAYFQAERDRWAAAAVDQPLKSSRQAMVAQIDDLLSRARTIQRP